MSISFVNADHFRTVRGLRDNMSQAADRGARAAAYGAASAFGVGVPPKAQGALTRPTERGKPEQKNRPAMGTGRWISTASRTDCCLAGSTLLFANARILDIGRAANVHEAALAALVEL